MGYKKITKFDLFYWIDASNIETKEKDILKTKINKIETGDNGKLFKDLPDTYPICTEYKNGVSCLYVLNKWYYGEEKKKSIFDLMLKRSEWKERLLTQLKKFASEIEAVSIDQSIDEAKNYLEYNKLQRIKQGRVFNVITIFCVLIALALLCLVMADAIVAFDNESIIYKFITPGATICGILDFIFGILFFRKERAEDDRERFLMLAIAKDQKKSLQDENDFLTKNNDKLEKEVAKLQGTNEELQGTNEELRGTNEELRGTKEKLEKEVEKLQGTNEELRGTKEKLEKEVEKLKSTSEIVAGQQEKLEQKEAKLGICEQCHVPLENDCNVCGHKNYPGMKGTVNKDYIDHGLNPNKAEQDCKSYNWTLKKNGECNYTVIFNNNIIILSAEARNICNNSYSERLAAPKYVKKIVFNAHVKNVKLKEDEKANCKNIKAYYENIQNIFPEVEIVAFAQPERCNGEIIKQYKLGENIFNGLYGKVNVKGLEYIAKAEKGCFGGWDREYCRYMKLECDGQECFQTD